MLTSKQQYNRDWYQRNKKYVAAKNQLRRDERVAHNKKWNAEVGARRLEWLLGLAREMGCVICGTEDKLVFHHFSPCSIKRWGLNLQRMGYNPVAIVEELRKGVVLCDNCHKQQIHISVWKHKLAYLVWDEGRVWDKYWDRLINWAKEELKNGSYNTGRSHLELVQDKPQDTPNRSGVCTQGSLWEESPTYICKTGSE